MGLVGCDGLPKIAIREQGLFPVTRSSDRYILSALVASGTPRHSGMIAPIAFVPASVCRRHTRRPACWSAMKPKEPFRVNLPRFPVPMANAHAKARETSRAWKSSGPGSYW